MPDADDYYRIPIQGPFNIDEEKLVEMLLEGKLFIVEGIFTAREARQVAEAMVKAAKKAWH